MIERMKKFDFVLITAIVSLSVFGLMMVYSSSFTLATLNYGDGRYFFNRQLAFFIFGLFVMFVSGFVSLKRLGRLSPLFVVMSLVMLMLVAFSPLGLVRNNSQRWLQLGPIVFQPSEMVKIFMVIYFSYFYSRRQEHFDNFFYGVFPPLILLALIAFPIIRQPDLGTTIHLLFISGLIVILSGVRKRHLFILVTIATSVMMLVAYSASYRIDRITSFRNPFDDIGGTGYQLVNSYVSLATGGLSGTGLGNSVQKLGYLPEAHTDFIMSVVAEELGVLGVLFVLGCYTIILVRGVIISTQVKPLYYKLLALGITFQIASQAAINLGAMSGVLPITGIPLPFISYGGTSLVFMMLASGILINVSGRRNIE